MFDIEYKGANAVVIATKKVKVMFDPKLSLVGLKDPTTKEAVVVATDPELAIYSNDSLLTIDGPGEYEVSDVSIRAVAADRYGSAKGSKELTIYRLEIGDVRIAVVGNIAPDLSEGQLEALGVVDLLILPVGGGGTLNATEAAQVARMIDVKTVVPIHYAENALKYGEAQDTVETFKKEFGGQVEETSKYKVKSSATIPAVSTIIELSRS